MPIDLDRVRAVVQDWIGGNYDHIIDGPPRAMTSFNGVHRLYHMFRFAVMLPGESDTNDPQTIVDGAVEGAVSRWFAGISQPDDTLVVFRRQPEVDQLPAWLEGEGIGQQVNFVHIRFRCHTMKVLDAIERGQPESGGLMGDANSARNESVLRSGAMQGQRAYVWSDGVARTEPEPGVPSAVSPDLLYRGEIGPISVITNSAQRAIIERESNEPQPGAQGIVSSGGGRQDSRSDIVRQPETRSAPRIGRPAIRPRPPRPSDESPF